MSKFSDPNYQLLERYFDILVNRTTGTQRSFLAGPRQSIWADGGVFTVLYEKDSTYGFVGKKFLIQEIDGNRFKMEYQGVYEDWKKYRTDTETESLSAIGISNEMYFRKDSFFHEWLARSENIEFRNYVNQEKTFAFFGKIWPVGQSKTIFSIEFEGLKDYTVKALPYHNQTTNLVEWLKVYFDQVHHEPYTMLKTAWSLMDAREIQLRWLGYIAQIYGIEINEELAELNLREWVENLIYFLKRIGTYDALYVIWLLFLSNSKNVMNVYERWDEWCDGGIASYDRFAGFHPGIPKGVRSYYGPDLKPINDFNWLEFYGQQPSGGAGELWYSQFDPTLYPVHATEKPDCYDSWDCGIAEEFPCYEARELNSFVSYIRTDTVGISAYDTVDTGTRTLTLPDQNFIGDFQHCAEISMSNQTTENCSFMFYGLSNDVNGFGTTYSDWIAVAIEKVGTQRQFRVYEQYNGIVYSSLQTPITDYEASKRYKVGIDRTCTSAGAMLEVYIYDGRREEPNLKEVITHVLQGCPSYTVLHAMNSKTDGLDGDFYGTVYPQHVDFSRFVESLGPTGYPVLTPHYIVEVDLNTEPLIDVQPFNDLFQGQSFIINEFLADELIRNWEYVRPINKHVIYHELISPSASEAKGVTSIPLYPLDSNGAFDTFFTGSQYLSGSGPTPSAGVATYLYTQAYANKEWNINHGLGRYVVFQAWESLLDCEFGKDDLIAKRIEPKNVIIEPDESLTVRFAQPVKGWATIAGSSPYLSYLHKECGCPDDTWTVFHDFEDTPSGGLVGYPSGVGPLVNLWLHSSSSSSVSYSSSSISSYSSSSSSLSSSSSSLSSSSSSSSSSLSSSSSSSSVSSSSSSSFCANDDMIPSGADANVHRWDIVRNDGGYAAGFVYTNEGAPYIVPSVYISQYNSRFYFPDGCYWSVETDWHVKYIFPGPQLKFGIKERSGFERELSVVIDGFSGTRILLVSSVGGILNFWTGIDSWYLPSKAGKFKITKTAIDTRFYVWTGMQWEWNGDTNGLAAGIGEGSGGTEVFYAWSGGYGGVSSYLETAYSRFQAVGECVVCGSSSSSSTSSSSSSLSSSSSSLSSSSSSSLSSSLSSSSLSSSSISSSSSSTSYEPYENLTTYTEVDSDGDFTITPLSLTFDSVRQDAVSYVYYDFGLNYFGNFKIEFEVEVSASTPTVPDGVHIGLSNTIGTVNDWVMANNGIMVDTYFSGGNAITRVMDLDTFSFDPYGWASGSFVKHYFRLYRVGTTLTCEIYSNAVRTTLVDTLSITTDTDAYRYMYVMASPDTVGSATITGINEKFEVLFNSSSSSSVSSSSSSSSLSTA